MPKKGNIPWNKGKTGVLPEEVIKKCQIHTKEKNYLIKLRKN